MSTNIQSPYDLTSTEKEIINLHFCTHTDWEKDIFSHIKENLTKHLRSEQDNLCCYCKRPLGYDIKDVDIEHILPKSKYPIYTFNTKNLSLSCPGCNTSKGKKDVIKKLPIKLYPRSGSNVIIVHAHFDSYPAHIKIHNNIIYEGLSEKGCETIKICKLFRLKSVHEKAKQQLVTSPIEQLINNILQAPEDTQKLLKQVLMLIPDT